MNRFIHGALAVAAFAAAGAVSAQDLERNSLDDTSWGSDRGFSFQLDNDLFSGAHRDQDYSWGAALHAGLAASARHRPSARSCTRSHRGLVHHG